MQIAVLWFCSVYVHLSAFFPFFFCICFNLCSFNKREVNGEENDLRLMKKDIPLYCNVDLETHL